MNNDCAITISPIHEGPMIRYFLCDSLTEVSCTIGRHAVADLDICTQMIRVNGTHNHAADTRLCQYMPERIFNAVSMAALQAFFDNDALV